MTGSRPLRGRFILIINKERFMENGNLKRQAPASSAKYLLGAIALTFVLQMATVYVPILNPIFKTEPLILYRASRRSCAFPDNLYCRGDRKVFQEKEGGTRNPQ